MRRLVLWILVYSLVAGFPSAAIAWPPFRAGDTALDEPLILKRMTLKQSSTSTSVFGASQADTIYVGYSPTSTDPNKVGIGGVWDFDTDIAGTDSTQGWQFFSGDWASGGTSVFPYPGDRPIWYFDRGNEVNNGNTNLWIDRESRGIAYHRTGITGYWHVDNMASVSNPISGGASAWCGLRAPGDVSVIDELTGNALNGDLARHATAWEAPISGSWPGYGNQIDQILYRDISVVGDGSDVLSFRFRTDLSDVEAGDPEGSAWFNPDPTSMDNFVLDPVDSLMVWVGLPLETNVYDPNRRWLSEVIDFGSATQPTKLFSEYGRKPVSGIDSTVTVALPSMGGATTYRVAFQVKTNRRYADETYHQHGFDSADGAALIDDVILNGTPIGEFESPQDIRPRVLLTGGGNTSESNPANYWITTGKPAAVYSHIHNVFDLPYDDPCGALGSPDRLCDLIDNGINLSDHDDPDHAFFRESANYAESPTIDLSDGSPLRAAGVGTTHDAVRIEYQIYTGHMGFDEAVFWRSGLRYHGPGILQQADELVPGWSDFNSYGWVAISPDPECVVVTDDDYFDLIIPPPSQLDSLRLFVQISSYCERWGTPSLCGKPEGGYFDNIRACFVRGQAAPLVESLLLQDTFPFAEDIAPGTAAFDTSTATVIGSCYDDGTGIITFETLDVGAPFGTSTRVDLVFRILPGPANYSVPGDLLSPLVTKDPSRDFWGAYLADNGPFGSPGGHQGGIWSPDSWNSARMDSSDNGNLSPLVDRGLGIPTPDQWDGTLHEEDPNYAALAIERNLCFLIDPQGDNDDLNVCCSAAHCAETPFFESWPPQAYPVGTPTTTIEGTKIIPDGWFSPGTHMEYFMRRSDAPNGASGVATLPDTMKVDHHQDFFRFYEFAVLPDLWKDARFGGPGLACMLVVDANDWSGDENAVIGALDTLGYGKNNGAGRGWKEVDPVHPDPNNPSGFVSANLGQKGLVFDWFDCLGGAWFPQFQNRPGSRLAVTPPDPRYQQCKVGPTPAMLKTYYNTILWTGYAYDGISDVEASDDVGLLQDFLATSVGGSKRAVWLAGDDVAYELANSPGEAPALLSVYFAAAVEADDYRVAAGNITTPVVYDPLLPALHDALLYGYGNSCLYRPDVISVNGEFPGGVLASKYEDTSHRGLTINPGEYGAGVYRPADDISRFYTTFITGHSPRHLLGIGAASSTTDFGRITFIDDLLGMFNLCPPVGPVIAIGDLPGVSGAQVNFVRGAVPNPAVDNTTRIQFDLAQSAKVSIRFYNVAGRLVHEATVEGKPGPNSYRWDGATSSGIRTAPGVYFYRVSAPGIEFQNNNQRMVLLGRN